MASETVVGEVVYKVTLDSSGLKTSVSRAEKIIKEGIEKPASEAGKAAGDKTGGGFLKAAKSALTSAAVTKIFDGFLSSAKSVIGGISSVVKSSVMGFADYEQLIGGVETLFKQSAGIVEEYANNAYKTAGLSANDYMETITSFSASLLQSLGGDTKEVARIGDMAVTDMADNANKMGSSMESIQNAYQGFAKQNYTMLDNLKLGYGGTKGEMERLLEDAEKISGIHYDISSLSDVYSAIHVIQGELGITGTTAKEAQETISGSLAMVKSSWANLVVEVSQDRGKLEEVAGQFVSSVGSLFQNIIPVIKVALSHIPGLIMELIPQLVQLITSVAPDLITGIVSLVTAISAQLPALISAVAPALLEGLMQLVLGMAEILPDVLMAVTDIILNVVDVLTAPENLDLLLNSAITLLMALVDAVPTIVMRLIDALPRVIQGAVKVLTDPKNIKRILESAVTLFFAIVNAVPQILGSLLRAFGSIVGSLWGWIVGTFTGFATNFGNIIGGVFRAAINGVLGFIEGFVNTPINLLNGFIGAINGAFGALGVNIGFIPTISLPRMASGGIVEATMRGSVIMAGENGEDEWVVPESKMASLIDKLEERTAGGSNVTINVSGVFATSATEQRKVAEQIYQRLQELDRARFGGVTI